MSLVVPDSIEPVLGYKWLTLYPGKRLFSSYGGHDGPVEWPPFAAQVAVCHAFLGAKWQPVDAWQVPYKPKMIWHDNYRDVRRKDKLSHSWRRGHRAWEGGPFIDGEPPKRPKLCLPPGYQWSFGRVVATHAAPAEDCTCGIYIVDKEKYCEAFRSEGRVLVEVALWGRVVVASDGARGEFAYPQRIVSFASVESEMIRAVGKQYGIPTCCDPKPKPVAPAAPSVAASEPVRKRRLW